MALTWATYTPGVHLPPPLPFSVPTTPWGNIRDPAVAQAFNFATDELLAVALREAWYTSPTAHNAKMRFLGYFYALIDAYSGGKILGSTRPALPVSTDPIWTLCTEVGFPQGVILHTLAAI